MSKTFSKQLDLSVKKTTQLKGKKTNVSNAELDRFLFHMSLLQIHHLYYRHMSHELKSLQLGAKLNDSCGEKGKSSLLIYLGILLSPFSISSSSESSLYSKMNTKVKEHRNKTTIPWAKEMQGEATTKFSSFQLPRNLNKQSLLFDHKILVRFPLSKSAMGRLVRHSVI